MLLNHLLKTAALLSAVLLTSCQKEATEAITPGKQVTVFEHGAVIGAATTKTIGAEGGTLATADGRVALTIPAGAVAKATEFSIQPVENTLPGARSESFRLLPEGTTFAKPLTLRLSYANLPLEGTVPEALFLAYQNASGQYRLVTKTTLNTTEKTLTVTTTHFSDWQVCEYYRVVADRTTLKAGEKALLKLQQIGNLEIIDGVEIGLVDSVWKDYPGKDGEKMTWELDGEGKLAPAGTVCTYTAPNQTPAKNPVFVNFTFSNFQYDTDPATGEITGRSPMKMIFPVPIEIVTEQYLKFTFDDQTFDINGDCATGCITGEFDGKFFLRATAPNRRVLDITIKDFPGRKGQYVFDKDLAALEFSMGPGSKVYAAMYSGCQSPYNTVNSDGAIQITQWAAKPGEYVEGNFKTILYPNGECGQGGKAITCKFRVKRLR
ncbi:hypothetical protein ACFQ4C_26535 [Larkinella insperata]|uniref:ZU5 domain-containing protein n=1 Tax=Larkinella insperata TaxID=332158 RepID=A0ABW3QCY9_9BACT|nr:hypothetical protein [Larkinella insperata]